MSNLLFLQLNCCGANYYGDWLLPNTSWSKTHSPDVVPLSCCNEEANEAACESATNNEIDIKLNNGTFLIYQEVSIVRKLVAYDLVQSAIMLML